MRKLWLISLLIFLAACGGYRPKKGEVELKLEKKMDIPLEESEHPRLSIALSPSGEIYFSGPDTGVWKLTSSGNREEVLKPGILNYVPSLYFSSGCFWATTPRQVAKMCPGEPARKGVLDRFYERVMPTAKGHLLGSYLELKEGKPLKKLVLIGDKDQPEKLLAQSAKPGTLIIKSPRGVSAISVPEIIPTLLWTYSSLTDHIIVGESDRYSIKILNPNGELVRKFHFDVPNPDFPLEERRKIAPTFLIWKPVNRERTLEAIAQRLPHKLPVLKRIMALPSGLLLIEVNEAPGKSHFDIVSEKGKYLYKFYLPRGFSLIKVLRNGWLVLRKGKKFAIYLPRNLRSVFQPPSSL